MTMEWHNPSTVARYCNACARQCVCGLQCTTARTAANMTDANTWAVCMTCGEKLTSINNSHVWVQETHVSLSSATGMSSGCARFGSVNEHLR
jgi:hypothetical protein